MKGFIQLDFISNSEYKKIKDVFKNIELKITEIDCHNLAEESDTPKYSVRVYFECSSKFFEQLEQLKSKYIVSQIEIDNELIEY